VCGPCKFRTQCHKDSEHSSSVLGSAVLTTELNPQNWKHYILNSKCMRPKKKVLLFLILPLFHSLCLRPKKKVLLFLILPLFHSPFLNWDNTRKALWFPLHETTLPPKIPLSFLQKRTPANRTLVNKYKGLIIVTEDFKSPRSMDSSDPETRENDVDLRKLF